MPNASSFPYTKAIPLSDLSLQNGNDFVDSVCDCFSNNLRLLAYVALPNEEKTETEGLSLLALFYDGTNKMCFAFRSTPVKRMPSLAERFPAIQLFEREIHEDCGLPFEGHPWLKSVRKTPDHAILAGKRFPFFRTKGRQVHEVAVGPVHAGIIEPGHFRFQCYGENVIHLEIALGYQHRGLEALLLQTPVASLPYLLECASGDSSIAHSLAHAVLMERLSSVTVSEAVNQSRTIALELERLANHVGDLGAIAGDTGFLPTSSWNGRIRGDILTMTALLCGNRFGRSYVRPGSVLTIPDDALCEELEKRRQLSERDAIGSVGCMFKSNSVLERMHGIGTLSKDTAKTLGILGVAAKASGLPLDARFSSPLSREG